MNKRWFGERASRDEELRDDIETEIADHLASVADELKREGAAASQAQQRAVERFGDVARIVRRCLWAQRGDEIMLRAVGVGLVALLTIAVIVVAFGSWRAQESLTERLAQLGDQLEQMSASQERLAETQRDLVERPSRQPAPRITGRMRFRDKPPAPEKLDAWIWHRAGQFKSPLQFRQIAFRDDGSFDSGPLPPGEYILTAAVDTTEQTQRLIPYCRWITQSEPFYLYYAGVELPGVEFDLRPKGVMRVTLVDEVPDQLNLDGLPVEFAVRPVLFPFRPPTATYPLDTYPMNAALRPEVREWPVTYMTSNVLMAPALGAPSEFSTGGWRLTLPAGKYRFAVLVHGYIKQPAVELIESLALARIPPESPYGGGGAPRMPWGWAMPAEPLEAFSAFIVPSTRAQNAPRMVDWLGKNARVLKLVDGDEVELRIRVPRELLDLLASNPGREKLAELLTPRIATLEGGDTELSQND